MTEIERYKKRLTAAFLLLGLCPICGEKCTHKYIARRKRYYRIMKCPTHQVVSESPAMDMWSDLQKYDGV